LRSAEQPADFQLQVSPVGGRGYSTWPAGATAGINDTSTPIRHQQDGRYEVGLLPPPYYPPSPWHPPYHPYAHPYQYPYYPASPVSPTSISEATSDRSMHPATAPTDNTPGLRIQQRPGEYPRNQLLSTPAGSQDSVSTRDSNEVSLVLDGSVNLSSDRWDLSPVVVATVSASGGINNESIKGYLNKSAANFQELVKSNPEPGVLEEALAGSCLELQVRNPLFFLMKLVNPSRFYCKKMKSFGLSLSCRVRW
jgi:hypothetical protein